MYISTTSFDLLNSHFLFHFHPRSYLAPEAHLNADQKSDLFVCKREDRNKTTERELSESHTISDLLASDFIPNYSPISKPPKLITVEYFEQFLSYLFIFSQKVMNVTRRDFKEAAAFSKDRCLSPFVRIY